MVQINVEPIYRLFSETGTEAAAYTYLKNLIDTKYSLKAAQDGFGVLKSTKQTE